MRFSLRTLMIVVTLVCVACFLVPQTHFTPWGKVWSWSREQRTAVFVVGVVTATVAIRALARSSSYEKS